MWKIPLKEYRLANGMEVAVIANPIQPVVAVQLWYRVGSRNDYPGKSGLAHFLEHMMFKGTDRMREEAISIRIQEMGGECNAFTSEDATVYVCEIPSERLKEVLEMEADRMVSLRLRHFDEEKKVIMEERRRFMENQPEGVLLEQIRAMMFSTHPYRNPVIGWMENLERIQRTDMRRFHQIYYHPGNAFLVLVGDVKEDAAFKVSEEVFGSIPAREKPALTGAIEEPSERFLRLCRSGLASFVFDTYLVPDFRSAPFASLEVLALILGEGLSSRLYTELIEKSAVASVVDADVEWLAESGIFAITLYPMQDIPWEKTVQAMELVLNKIKTDGVEEWELNKAKKMALSDLIFGKEGNENLAYYLGRLHILDSWHRIHTIYEAIHQVTEKDVQQAAIEYLTPSRRTRGVFEAQPS